MGNIRSTCPVTLLHSKLNYTVLVARITTACWLNFPRNKILVLQVEKNLLQKVELESTLRNILQC